MSFSVAASDAILGTNLVAFESMAPGKKQEIWLGDAWITLSTPANDTAAIDQPPERVHHVRLDSLTIHNPREGGVAGNPELFFQCNPEAAPQVRINVFPEFKRSECVPGAKPRKVELPFLRWRENYGSTMLCSIYETDGAPPINSLGMKLGPKEFNVNIGARDQLLGSAIVHFEDLSPGQTKVYHVGEASFTLSGHDAIAVDLSTTENQAHLARHTAFLQTLCLGNQMSLLEQTADEAGSRYKSRSEDNATKKLAKGCMDHSEEDCEQAQAMSANNICVWNKDQYCEAVPSDQRDADHDEDNDDDVL